LVWAEVERGRYRLLCEADELRAPRPATPPRPRPLARAGRRASICAHHDHRAAYSHRDDRDRAS
jgi:hypothetical protein